MAFPTNSFGQPIGAPLPDWRPPPAPTRGSLQGRLCRVESFDLDRHAESLYEANALDQDGRTWTYLPYGPFESLAVYRTWAEACCAGNDPAFYAVVEHRNARAVGVASYLRIQPTSGSIEIGHIHFSPELQRCAAATEALHLLIDHAFTLGYRRCEWKCDALNAPSRSAAQRLGFSYEGTFRQATVYKGRNRDTAWYAIVDSDWPRISAAHSRWLSPDNFDSSGAQKTRLSDLTKPLLQRDDGLAHR